MLESGDHENYYAVNCNNLTSHLIYQNCSFVNADCEARAVKIRTKDEHSMWPNIRGNTLVFSKVGQCRFLNKTDIQKDIIPYELRKTVKFGSLSLFCSK